MKGIELPVNALIIIILAVLVLLGILALYAGVWSPSSGGVNLESAKNNACQMLASTNCQSDPATILISNFDANKNGQQKDTSQTPDKSTAWDYAAHCGLGKSTGDNLATLCLCYYNKSDVASCRILCGCQV